MESNNESVGQLFQVENILNEETELPHFVSAKIITVDFADLQHVNSFGIKKWCHWVASHSNVQSIKLINCPYVIVRSFSVVQGMLANNIQVRSFYVPYSSPTTNERIDSLYVYGENYEASGLKKTAYVLGSDGLPMELDIIKDKYFSFLNK